MYVIKKDGTREEFNVDKIIAAVNKSAARILYEFSTDEIAFICQFAYDRAESLKKGGITIQEMHNIVEGALERVNPAVAKSYRDYRNYKLDFIHMMDEVYTPVDPLHRRQEQCQHGQCPGGDKAKPDL